MPLNFFLTMSLDKDPHYESEEKIQPHYRACTLSATFYLLDITGCSSYSKLLQTFDSQINSKKSFSFEDIRDAIQSKLGLSLDLIDISDTIMYSTPYVCGVIRLPQTETNPIINQAIQEGSISISEDFFEFPNGHAICVRDIRQNVAVFFDPYIGREREIDLQTMKQFIYPNSKLLVIPKKI